MAAPYDIPDYYQDPSQLSQRPDTQIQTSQAFDPSQVPTGVPMDWAQDFITRNPGDYHRLESAYASERGGGASAAPQYATPTQQWNAQPSAPSNSSSQLYQLLMQRAQQGTAVNRNDPTVRAQVDPVVAQQTRASRNYLDDLAERSGPLANLQGERRLAAERSGQAAGALEAQVIGREQDARRQEIAQALQLWGNQLTEDQRLALQKELGYLSDATARRGQDVTSQGQNLNYDEFLRELALRQWIAGDQSAQGWAGLGGQ